MDHGLMTSAQVDFSFSIKDHTVEFLFHSIVLGSYIVENLNLMWFIYL